MSKEWRKRLDDMDSDVVAAHDMGFGSFWPALAVALALIDKGVLDREELLEIIESLHDLATAWSEPGRAEDVTVALDHLRQFLREAELSEGQVLQQVRTLVDVETLKFLLRRE